MTDTSTRKPLGHEIGLLRRIVERLAQRPGPSGPITQEVLRAEGFARANRTPLGLVGILRAGYPHFMTLSETMFGRSAEIERGSVFKSYQDEFFELLLSSYLGHDPEAVTEADVVSVDSRMAAWFAGRAAKRTVFIPCVVSPWPSPRFSIGPINFVFVDDVAKTEYNAMANVSWDQSLDNLVAEMRKEHAGWLAVIEVEGCDRDRSQEIAELGVDIGLVAFQLAQPYMGTRNMSRLANRRGPGMKLTLSVSEGGETSVGRSKVEAGLPIGDGYLGQMVRESAQLMVSVGNRLRSFTTGSFQLPKLEQAWCDAAYWLHQGLAEPLDSIAVTKLETAIEVLLHAESSSGSEKRIIAAMETFYGLKPDDPITPFSQVTAKAFAKGFVRDRSRVLHGTWSTLNVRLAGSRDSLENLAITLVRATVQELDLYLQSPSPSDDTEAFLDWIKARRQQARITPASSSG